MEISYRVNWNEKHYVLKLETPVSLKKHLASVPYGSVGRTGNEADVPVGTWLKTDKFSLGLDGIFAYNLTDGDKVQPEGILGLTLLRSPICGDFRMEELDYGEDYDVTDQDISEGGVKRSVVLLAEGKEFPLEFASFEIRTMKLCEGEIREYYMTEDEEMVKR